MRTTLDIDDDILQAAKELASAQRKTAGQVISELARQALTQAAPLGDAPAQKNGWHLLPNRDGLIVTKELVDQLSAEADLDDAGVALLPAMAARE